MNRLLVALVLSLVGASAHPTLARVRNIESDQAIEGSYIVKLKDSSSKGFTSHSSWLLSHLESSKSSKVYHFYEMEGFKGYSGNFDNETLSAILASPDVEYVEQDQRIYTLRRSKQAGVHWTTDNVEQAASEQQSEFASVTQTNPTWGLDRIDQASLPLDSKYTYNEAAGSGVDVYIIDTGILTTHNEFKGRITWGKTIPAGAKDTDYDGHGTHVAGIAAGTTYGVAKKANIIAVKMFDDNGSATLSDAIAALDWVLAAHKAKSNAKSVVNMSIGSTQSSVLDSAVNSAVASGLVIVVAAGNYGGDACSYSPSAATSAITVAASTSSDTFVSFSNRGSCVDIVAPGASILSAYIGSNTATSTISATSMASPHVAGAAALFMSQGITAANVRSYILNNASTNKISNIPSATVNKLLRVL